MSLAGNESRNVTDASVVNAAPADGWREVLEGLVDAACEVHPTAPSSESIAKLHEAIEVAAPFLAQPVAQATGGVDALSHEELFTAIDLATTVKDGRLSINVEAFRAALRSEQQSLADEWRELHEAFEAARYVPGDHPIVPVKIDRFMKTVERILSAHYRPHPAPSGQAVASLWVSAKPEDEKIGWTYDFDQTERLSRAAYDETGYDATMEVVEFVMAEADRRHKSALSQLHPADERAVSSDETIIAWHGNHGTEWRRKDGESSAHMTRPREYVPAADKRVIAEALREAIEFAEQDIHVLTPAGEAMVNRWRTALSAKEGRQP